MTIHMSIHVALHTPSQSYNPSEVNSCYVEINIHQDVLLPRTISAECIRNNNLTLGRLYRFYISDKNYPSANSKVGDSCIVG